MAKTSIIQLKGEMGFLGLYAFDPEMMSEEQACNTIENAIEASFQRDEAGDLEDGDVQTEADETLENLGIDRIEFKTVTTDRL